MRRAVFSAVGVLALAGALVALVRLGTSGDAVTSPVTHAVRCDAAQSDIQFNVCVLRAARFGVGLAPEGRYCGLNVVTERAACFSLQHEPRHRKFETRRYRTVPTRLPAAVQSTLSRLAAAYRLDPDGFSLPRHYVTETSILTRGPHDPVRISVNGWQSGDRGRMNQAVNTCLIDPDCVEQIDKALSERMRASGRFDGDLSAGVKIEHWTYWRLFPAQLGAPAVVWFCASSNCTQYLGKNNVWEFEITTADHDGGPAYGNPERTESLAWQAGRDSQLIWAGMRDSGFAMPEFERNRSLVCDWTGGLLNRCHWADAW